jgi:arylsulfatase A-like enzyme
MKILNTIQCIITLLPVIAGADQVAKIHSDDAKRPNVVLILSDDQGWMDYGFMGHKHIQTPNIDRLAASGVTFTRGYSAAPICAPSLGSIITGLYPHQHGVLCNDPVVIPRSRKGLPGWPMERAKLYQPVVSNFEKLETIADVLGKHGYTSLQTGKWWVGNFSSGGFDEGMTHGDPARGARHGDEGLKIGREGMEPIFRFIDSAQEQNKPFFVWYAPLLPHGPYTPPDNLVQKYMKVAPSAHMAKYWASCEWFDITCGQLMDYVGQKGLSKNTLFIYVCDNGFEQDPKDREEHIRSKYTPYDMGLRTPIIYSWEGVIKPELNTKDLVSSIDIAPTVYGILGMTSPEGLPGINVLDSRTLDQRNIIFAEQYNHDFSTPEESLQYTVAIGKTWKLIVPDRKNKPKDRIQLYNIEEDPFEKRNLADQHPGIVSRLNKQINEWWMK